jgi:hypothetical protein
MCSRSKHHLVWIVLGAVGLVLIGGRLAAAESSWYVAAQLGQSGSDAQFGAQHAKLVDDEADAAAVGVGYAVGRHLAVEAGYHELGSHRGFGSPCRASEPCIERLATLGLCAEGFECAQVLVPLDADIEGFSLALVPSWPVGEHISIRGKVGLMSWDGEISGGAAFGVIESLSGEDLLTGIGVQYDFSDSFGLVVSYEEVDLDVSWTSVGMNWRF